MCKKTKGFNLFLNIVRLIAYFLIYQYVFVVAGQFGGYLFYDVAVEPVSYATYSSLAGSVAENCRAGGLAVGMLLSSLAMIAHLLFFRYVHIGKGFLREVKGSVLFYATLFVGSMMVLFNILAAWSGLENNNEAEVEMLLGNPAGLLAVAVAAPVLEELLFRGAIQGALMRYFKQPWLAIGVAALLFGVIHANPVQIFYAACLGVGFGWLYYRTGSLLPAIIGHIVNNSIAAYSNVVYGADATDAVQGDTEGYAALAFTAALFMLLFARVINKRLPAVVSSQHEEGGVS